MPHKPAPNMCMFLGTGVMTAYPPLSLDDCSSPPGQGGALHADGAHAATAAQGPTAATQPTEPAWPEAGGQPTWRGAKGPAGPGRTPHRRAGGAAFHAHGVAH